MAHKAMDVYLNDHLGGAAMGVSLAGQIADHAAGTRLADLMTGLRAEIEADRDTLVGLAERMGVTRNPSSRRRAGWPRRPAA